jgi:hypothetical protein
MHSLPPDANFVLDSAAVVAWLKSKGRLPDMTPLEVACGKGVCDLVAGCLNKDPLKRPSASDVCAALEDEVRRVKGLSARDDDRPGSPTPTDCSRTWAV